MLKFLFVFLLSLSAFSTFAGENQGCTEWQKQDGLSCIFAGGSGNIYRRQCENPCWSNVYSGNMGPNCEQEYVCNVKNPTTFEGVCSDWVREGGVTCFDPNTQSWGQHWVRSCTIGLKESWCSRNRPLE